VVPHLLGEASHTILAALNRRERATTAKVVEKESLLLFHKNSEGNGTRLGQATQYVLGSIARVAAPTNL
jgi:hypothetical protein